MTEDKGWRCKDCEKDLTANQAAYHGIRDGHTVVPVDD